jgi:hypothetical protein
MTNRHSLGTPPGTAEHLLTIPGAVAPGPTRRSAYGFVAVITAVIRFDNWSGENGLTT